MKWRKAEIHTPPKWGVYFVRNHCMKKIYSWAPLFPGSELMWLDDNQKPLCVDCHKIEWLDED